VDIHQRFRETFTFRVDKSVKWVKWQVIWEGWTGTRNGTGSRIMGKPQEISGNEKTFFCSEHGGNWFLYWHHP
jgi:hypothetical protein